MSRALHAARPTHKVDEVRCPLPATTALRLWLAITSLLSLAVGLSGLITGVGALRTIGLLVFCAVGIGSAPWQLNRSVQPAGRLALTALTSISVLALVATAMVTARSWHPAIAFFVTAAACVVLHVVGAGRAVHEEHEDWQSFLRHCRTSLLLTAAFLVASFGLDATNVVRPSDLAALRYYQHLGDGRSGTVSNLLVLGGGDLPVFVPMKGGTHQILGRDSLELRVTQPPPPPKDLLPPPKGRPPAEQPSPPPPLLAGSPQRDSTREEAGIPSSVVVARLTAELIDYSGQPASRADLYALWSPQSSVYDSAYAIQSPREFVALRDAFTTSPYWNIDFAQNGTILFHFDSARYDAGSP